jgi:regulator of sirC expression with transglutaminase-like and TPR domain
MLLPCAAGKRATAWLKLGKLSKAVRDAELFVDQCPNSGDAHLVSAQARSADARGACSPVERARHLAVRCCDAVRRRQLLYEQGKYQNALKELEVAELCFRGTPSAIALRTALALRS